MRLEKAQHTASAHVTGVFGLLPRLLFVLLAAAMSLTQPPAMLAQHAKSDVSVAGAATARATEDKSIRPFRIRVPEEELVDLRRRLAATRWPDRETVSDRSQGVRRSTRSTRSTGSAGPTPQ